VEDRLLFVSTEVSPQSHADVGTDHAKLPLYLLNNKLCQRVIAVEKSPSAYHVAKQALWGREAEVRLGDGLRVLKANEVHSVSLCGMGGHLIQKILSQDPSKVPPIVIAQPNRDSHKVREWALRSGFHLVREQMATGFSVYEILTFHRACGPDKAYLDQPLELALHFGPRLLAERHPLLLAELKRKRKTLTDHPLHEEMRRVKLAINFLYSS